MVRVGKPSGVSESLWPHTLDAAIQRDPFAQAALEDAAKATAKARKSSDEDNRKNKGSLSAERAKRDMATDAVKASIQVCSLIALCIMPHLSTSHNFSFSINKGM